ncbi:MAG: hypothetical protein P1P67_04420 [Treponema phagedenis]|uniref:hypothetical protein n=1 Tax=Treponema phagedenis TaxID=162 RepID=UPI0001F63AF9|nr:hypothetical protein [Treponema phagedenis]EFW38729.1 hypothetical protein HMPREF9554_00764 [Treponema phagedenis F0421]NVP24081.1 hypothetical protein [Treponema phagedenis]QKS93378.1 hypothetical protein HPJ96_13090 [Treponema phagedenis]TYT78919.1 hypothetical protein FS559_07240 [Treponema phagedenis]
MFFKVIIIGFLFFQSSPLYHYVPLPKSWRQAVGEKQMERKQHDEQLKSQVKAQYQHEEFGCKD